MHTVEDLQKPAQDGQDERLTDNANPYKNMPDKERIRIKRRKVGKFIGLVGMETPAEEIAGRIQLSMERAIERGRAEMRTNEEVMLRRKKMA